MRRDRALLAPWDERGEPGTWEDWAVHVHPLKDTTKEIRMADATSPRLQVNAKKGTMLFNVYADDTEELALIFKNLSESDSDIVQALYALLLDSLDLEEEKPKKKSKSKAKSKKKAKDEDDEEDDDEEEEDDDEDDDEEEEPKKKSKKKKKSTKKARARRR